MLRLHFGAGLFKSERGGEGGTGGGGEKRSDGFKDVKFTKRSEELNAARGVMAGMGDNSREELFVKSKRGDQWGGYVNGRDDDLVCTLEQERENPVEAVAVRGGVKFNDATVTKRSAARTSRVLNKRLRRLSALSTRPRQDPRPPRQGGPAAPR
jgi:hypothetical protein